MLFQARKTLLKNSKGDMVRLMLMFFKKRLVSAVGIIFVMSILIVNVTKADITSCQASLVARAVSPNSENSFTIHLTNTDSRDINSIRITRPSSNFTIIGSSAPGWSDSNTAAFAYESGSTLSPGNAMDISIDVQSANVQADPADWVVETADVPGQNLFRCSGSLDMAITGQVTDTTPPNLSNVIVTSLSTTSVNISWSTDEPSDSQINYGLDNSYGNSTDVDTNMVNDHSMTLTGLSPGTGYHYQAVSSDAAGNIGYSADDTFLTAAKAVIASITAPLGVAVTNPGDKVPPQISLTSKLPRVVSSFPAIEGIASDNLSVARIEYSTDGGHNWLPVDKAAGLGGKAVAFSFTPLLQDDGSYSLLARAIDGGGNITTTPAMTVVIDRLPPLVGGSVLSLGPQVLSSNSNGQISTLAGIDEKISLGAVGGPTSIILSAMSSDIKNLNKSFTLTQSAETGLWSGIISFNKPGSYKLVANSSDGAGNKTTKTINDVVAAAPAKVLKANGRPASAKVTAYYLEPDSNNWVIWDAQAYGQDNPQTTDAAGNFSMFLPAGTYYIKAAGKGFASITSRIFSLKTPSPILTTLKSSRSGGFINNTLSSLSVQQIGLNFSAQDKAGQLKSNLLGRQAPDFSLTNTAGQTINPAGLLGRPTILSFMSSWAPTTNAQLPALNQLSSNKDFNVEPIALQQNVNEMRAYQAISGYNLAWLADPDSTTSANFITPSLPTHYFIDRNGVIREIVTGVLSEQELQNALSEL
jgi:peroxiredoxin/chitodextrinase